MFTILMRALEVELHISRIDRRVWVVPAHAIDIRILHFLLLLANFLPHRANNFVRKILIARPAFILGKSLFPLEGRRLLYSR
jgi:hypothetical protein